MTQKVLVLGGCGMLGQPIANQLQVDGFQVRILARDVEKTQSMFDDGFEIVQGDVTDICSTEDS